MKDNSIGLIISMIAICVFMHYFFTMDILWKYLGNYNLSIVSIISWEDVQFSMASINSKILKEISTLLLVPFVIVNLFIIIHKKKIGFKTVKKKNSPYLYISLIIIALSISTTVLYLKEGKTPALLFAIVMLSIVVYYKYRKYAVVLLISLFLLAKVLYGDITKKAEQLYNNDIKFELNDGKIIQSDSINKLVFFGTKYIILENDSPNVKLYPTDRIKEIEWINKRKTNQTDTIKATL